MISALPPTPTPDLVGLSTGDARAITRRCGLSVVVEERSASRGLWGTVLGQEPAPDTTVALGTIITLVVGAKPRTMVPDVRERDEEVALSMLREAGLGSARRVTRRSDKLPEGYVMRTRPRAGAYVSVGSCISYVVATGPRTKVRQPRRERRWNRTRRLPDGTFMSLPEKE